MKYGQLILGGIGVALLVTGVIVALMSSLVAGVAVMVIGLFPLAMELSRWHELEAQVTRVAVKLRLAKAQPPLSAAQIEPPSPDVRLLWDPPDRRRLKSRHLPSSQARYTGHSKPAALFVLKLTEPRSRLAQTCHGRGNAVSDPRSHSEPTAAERARLRSSHSPRRPCAGVR